MGDTIWEGFTCAVSKILMGQTAENLAEKYKISRQDQDEVALRSQRNACNAIGEGKFREEIVPVPVAHKKGQSKIIDTDERPRSGLTMEDLAKLRPVFKEDGTVTAGNASGINDGAAALLVAEEQRARELGWRPRATIVASAAAGVAPEMMGLAPVDAVRKLCAKMRIEPGDFDLVELNEAFAVQALAVIRELKLDEEKVNVNGGAVALGHPLGATGARIVTTLLYEMEKRDVRLGLATLCIGGGMGMAMAIEREA